MGMEDSMLNFIEVFDKIHEDMKEKLLHTVPHLRSQLEKELDASYQEYLTAAAAISLRRQENARILLERKGEMMLEAFSDYCDKLISAAFSCDKKKDEGGREEFGRIRVELRQECDEAMKRADQCYAMAEKEIEESIREIREQLEKYIQQCNSLFAKYGPDFDLN